VARDDLNTLPSAAAQELAANAPRLDPDRWRRRAMFLFEGPTASRQFLAMLDGYDAESRSLSGIVLVDDPSGTLRLRQRSIHGRLVVICTGSVELEDVTLRDRASDLLIVQAGRRLDVAGRVEAALIARGDVEARASARLVGALLLGRDPGRRDVAATLEADGARYRGDGSSYAVALAPWSTARDLEIP
jgi:hypothetical protein